MSEGEEGTERQAVAEGGEGQPRRNVEGEQEKSERLEIEKTADAVRERLIQLEQGARSIAERSANGSPQPVSLAPAVLTDKEMEIINQYNVMRWSLAIPLERMNGKDLPDLEVFQGPQEPSDFAPRMPLPDWKPLPESRLRSSVAVAPPFLDFGHQEVRTESDPPKTVTLSVTNDATEPVEIISVGLGGPFPGSFRLKEPPSTPPPPGTSPTCTPGLRLGPGGACTAQVTFKPETAASLGALLVFVTTGGQLEVALIGEGDTPPPPPIG